jgi:ribonuclease BN (tRNA processing enzyme)
MNLSARALPTALVLALGVLWVDPGAEVAAQPAQGAPGDQGPTAARGAPVGQGAPAGQGGRFGGRFGGGFGGGFGRGAAAATGNAFIVLGTSSGPNSEADRAQPANALVVDGQVYLVDAGDGAVAQLAKAGQGLGAVRGVFLSHLHFDHTGGMFAVVGLRAQLQQRAPLLVYGPPGTEALIAGLLAAAAPGMAAAYGIPGESWTADIAVVELADGDTVSLPGFEVTVAENTHYQLSAGDERQPDGTGLSFRFDLADRSIVYTGDTGPSDAVVTLARDADLLVSEMIDVDAVLAQMGLGGPGRAEAAVAGEPMTSFERHMYLHHMTPFQVGELARDAAVGRVVVTHFAPNPMSAEQAQAYLDRIADSYDGAAELAADLERY